MATVAQVAKAALQYLLVQDAEAELQPSEYQDFIFAMNAFMMDLDAREVSLGYTEVSDLGDNVTVPVGALRGVITNMAIEVADQFGKAVSPSLQRIADASMETMIHIGTPRPTSSLPGNLPRGSGNTGSGIYVSRFYPDTEASILAEASGFIALESGT